MTWSWEHKNWPSFVWNDSKLKGVLYKYSMEAGKLAGSIDLLSSTAGADVFVDRMVEEAIASSEIEGEFINPEDVRSSIRSALGLTSPQNNIKDYRAKGIADLLLSVRNEFREPLTKERLFEWHKKLFYLDRTQIKGYKEAGVNQFFGYKVMMIKDGKLTFGADNRISFNPIAGTSITMPGEDVYLKNSKQHAIDHYSGLADDEALIKIRFNKEDIRTGLDQFDQFESEISVSKGVIESVNAISDEYLATLDDVYTQDAMGRRLKVGAFRDSKLPMQIVSGAIGREKIHYEAPPSAQVEHEMGMFLEWYNERSPFSKNRTDVIEGPIRAAVAYAWFESIHGFDDGNGRLGRAIIEHAISQDLGRPTLMALSSTLVKNRKLSVDSFKGINKASGNLDLTDFVSTMVNLIYKSQLEARNRVNFILEKASYYNAHDDSQLNEQQRKVIAKLFAGGRDGFSQGLSAKKYMSITGVSKATATRHLSDLVAEGFLFHSYGSGRSTRYSLNIPSEHKRATPTLEY